MEAKVAGFFKPVVSFFSSPGDVIPWCDSEIVLGCEREVAENKDGVSDERRSESIMRLSWALVHSRQSEDVNRGIAMLINYYNPIYVNEKLQSHMWKYADGVFGVGLTASAVGIVVSVLTAALVRRY